MLSPEERCLGRGLNHTVSPPTLLISVLRSSAIPFLSRPSMHYNASHMLTTLRQDLAIASRSFRRSPGFALAAILSLAIGIGANTSIFSVTNALLLRPLPFPDSGRLVILWNRSPGLNIAQDWFSTAQYFDIQRNHSGLEQVAIAIGGNENLTGDGPPERIGVVRLSANLLPMLAAKTCLGRLFTLWEDSPAQ